MHTSGPLLEDVASHATPDEAEFLFFSYDCVTTGASSHNDHMMYHIFALNKLYHTIWIVFIPLLGNQNPHGLTLRKGFEVSVQ